MIKDAGDLNIAGLARKIADLAERTRNNKIGPDELSGGTFTITNTGSSRRAVRHPDHQPAAGRDPRHRRDRQAADGDHRPRRRDVIAVRSMVYLALTYDHRLVDGADAARFLTAVRERLEAGEFEADLGL